MAGAIVKISAVDLEDPVGLALSMPLTLPAEVRDDTAAQPKRSPGGR
jgi:hypothetical protein